MLEGETRCGGLTFLLPPAKTAEVTVLRVCQQLAWYIKGWRSTRCWHIILRKSWQRVGLCVSPHSFRQSGAAFEYDPLDSKEDCSLKCIFIPGKSVPCNARAAKVLKNYGIRLGSYIAVTYFVEKVRACVWWLVVAYGARRVERKLVKRRKISETTGSYYLLLLKCQIL